MSASVPGRSLPSLGRPASANLIPYSGRGLYAYDAYDAYVLAARFVRAPALMSLIGSEKHDCPEFISLKSPQYIF